jgi:caffeoyl-CoA O-methyltransferase
VEIVDPRILEYLRRLYDDGDPVRTEMETLGRERNFPIVGPLVGRHLILLTLAIRARRVFELGSGYG